MILAAAAVALCSCTNKNAYKIEGTLDGEQTVYLLDEQMNVIDSAAVKNGAFEIKGFAEKPSTAFLLNARDPQSANLVVRLFLEPGTIKVAADEQDANNKIASGTPANDANNAFKTAVDKLTKEYRDSTTTDERRTAIEKEYKEMTVKAVKENATNYFGVALLPDLAYDLSGKEVLDLIALFTPELQQTDAMTKIKSAAQQKIKSEVGQPYINVEQKNAAGEVVSLKSVVENPDNKYILLDFWASWCHPCMGEVPTLKKTYEEFHKKGFEIFGVSFDKEDAKWQAAIKENGMNWIHVSEVNGFDNQAAKDYAIQGIPSNFLISHDGKIIASNLRGEELYKKIAELLAE